MQRRLLQTLRHMSSVASSSSSPLASFSSCEVSDALVKLGHSNGGLLSGINRITAPSADTRICAPAYIVKMVLTSDTVAPKLSEHFVDTAVPGAVVLIDAPHEAKNAVWGGLMTAGALSRGAVGVIISGRVRDVGEHRSQGFPVFARGHSTVGQSPNTRPSAVNVPVRIRASVSEEDSDAVQVNPGDWLIADEDGVVCVPQALEADVVRLAEKGREVDTKCMEDIKAGLGVQASFKKHRGK